MSLTAIAYVLTYVGLCTAGLFGRPMWAIGAYMAAFYLHPNSKWWGQDLPDMRWSLIAALVLLVSVVRNRPQGESAFPLDGGLKVGMSMLLVYMIVQLPWVLSVEQQQTMLILFVKYFVLLYLLHLCFHDRKLLSGCFVFHVMGCAYLGIHAWQTAGGGRFENFGGPGIGDANTGGTLLATGLIFCAAFILGGSRSQRLLGLLSAPFILNGIILTQSRGAVVAMAIGFMAFMFLMPVKYRVNTWLYAVLGVVALSVLTPSEFWDRIGSLQDLGDNQVEYDATAGRADLMAAQLKMAADHPLGVGHRGTALLSPYYMDASLLTSFRGSKIRSSHNAYLSMAVNYGVLGVFLAIGWLLWMAKRVVRTRLLARRLAIDSGENLEHLLLVACVSSVVSFVVSDVVGDFSRLEPRFWYLAALTVTLAKFKVIDSSADTLIGIAPPIGRAVT